MKLPATEQNDSSAASTLAIDRNIDFSDYMWMGEEMEEFDSKCLMELYEEDFIESCFEELFEEEEQFAEEMENYLSQLTQDQVGCLVRQLDAVAIDFARDDRCEIIWSGELNPNAAVFIPAGSVDDETDVESDVNDRPK